MVSARGPRGADPSVHPRSGASTAAPAASCQATAERYGPVGLPSTIWSSGADGLGKPVVRALNTVNIEKGFEAGLAIVIVAILLDRFCRQGERRGE